jgi:hypothetical protein
MSQVVTPRDHNVFGFEVCHLSQCGVAEISITLATSNVAMVVVLLQVLWGSGIWKGVDRFRWPGMVTVEMTCVTPSVAI